jgi:hypothetical protein
MITHRLQILPGVWVARIEPSPTRLDEQAPYRLSGQINPRTFRRQLARAWQADGVMEDYYHRNPTARPAPVRAAAYQRPVKRGFRDIWDY